MTAVVPPSVPRPLVPARASPFRVGGPLSRGFVVEVAAPRAALRRLVVRQPVVVGREGHGVVVDDPKVSRRHLVMRVEDSGLVVEDLGSTRGTRVNGTGAMGPTEVAVGGRIYIGDTKLTVISETTHQRRATDLPGGGSAADRRPSPRRRPRVIERLERRPRARAASEDVTGALAAGVVDPGVMAPEPVLTPEPVVVAEPNSVRVDPPRRRRSDDEAATDFPNYLQVRRRLPLPVWHAIRLTSVGVFFFLCVMLWIRPAGGLFFFWRVLVPVLPLLFFVAPGVWRNVCPLAAANQVPRLLGFTRGHTLPKWLRDRAYLIAITTFLVIVPTRNVELNKNGPALSVLLVVEIVTAFVGGAVFKGKSGFCSSICPLLPVQRLYGQAPVARVPNSHCQSCVGCAKNCYDFNPAVAYQADLADHDMDWSQPRKLFAGALPGVVVGFFAVRPNSATLSVYGLFAAAVLVSIGLFFMADSYLRIPSAWLTALWGASAINLFYWYQAQPVGRTLTQVAGRDATFVVWPLRTVVLGLSLVWLWRASRTHRSFALYLLATAGPRLPLAVAHAVRAGAAQDIEVRFTSVEAAVLARKGQSLLEVAEKARLPIEVGCRMGMCGADPIAIVDGESQLSPIEDIEAKTLHRLGFAANTRLACCANINGPVCVSLDPDKATTNGNGHTPALHADPALRSVVVIGCGVAGVTTADFVRRRHPDCEIHLVGREAHPLYNRMGISRLIHGRSAMQGLYLLDDSWYDDNRVTLWLNTQATGISIEDQAVTLGTGDSLPFDRLVVATGSSSSVPAIAGLGMPGTFVLREASDAIAIRSYAQEHDVRVAVVVGGGLLGLEGAHALRSLGLGTILLDRGERLLGKQVDHRASELLAAYFTGLGIQVLAATQAGEIRGNGRVEEVVLDDGTAVAAGMVLVCAGITPNVTLAQEAGIAVNRGIVVDRCLRTSAPSVYAVGDCAELEGSVTGLWPVAVGHAEVAATNLVGAGEEMYLPAPQPVILKGVGIDVVSVGRVDPVPGDTVIALEEGPWQYRKLIVESDGHLAGGLVVGRPQDARLVMAAVPKAISVDSRLESLRSGDWASLEILQPVGR